MSALGFDDSVVHATDLSANFYTHFQTVKGAISSRLETLAGSGSRPSSDVDEITAVSLDIVKLRKDLVDATPYLPSYDRGKCEQELKALEETLSRHRAPKSKFTFKRKPASSTPSTSTTVSSPSRRSPVPPSPSVPMPCPTTNLTYSSYTSMHLTLASLIAPTPVSLSQPPDLPRSSDITLTDLRECVVNLFPISYPSDVSNMNNTTLTITALHARALHRVVLVVPPIDGSVLLHDVRDSIVVVGCHQFRMHDSSNTTVLLHVHSRPTIERSHDIQFGTYPESCRHASSENFFQRPSRLAMTQDFDWIKLSPSPNWSLLDSSTFGEAKMARLMTLANKEFADEKMERMLEEILPRESCRLGH